ncbi:riboflavin synthase [Synechococcus sp. Tobar12-5m-g]|uniref:riboflavin synthase n=1 Tax=unclassified Synechococcus TaxID=2626047 RepID=UPI0020CCD351|nr:MULTISPECIES: riboflavin synthase [unclassified Synechococcus]MCP9771467.1 riboflavin synthase [Synechococcus sp. Tobar12-5m-g]MCP9872406.1 riboflavin synthase [Synechococcus sp. Cruz CV-v-12]
MFTGLVQAVGRLRRQARGVVVEGLAGEFSIALGDSVAVDGVCLTVAELQAGGFRADVSEETLQRSTLAAKAALGAAVNLEPALRLSDRLGGHLVSGHVDGLGEVTGIVRQPGSWRLELRWLDPAYGRYVCDKASVAVDGISLTVASASPGGERFWIAVIPLTWASTTLGQRRVGDAINLEADLLAKYTERLLGAGAAPRTERSGAPMAAAEIEPGWLAEQGWA